MWQIILVESFSLVAFTLATWKFSWTEKNWIELIKILVIETWTWKIQIAHEHRETRMLNVQYFWLEGIYVAGLQRRETALEAPQHCSCPAASWGPDSAPEVWWHRNWRRRPFLRCSSRNLHPNDLKLGLNESSHHELSAEGWNILVGPILSEIWPNKLSFWLKLVFG